MSSRQRHTLVGLGVVLGILIVAVWLPHYRDQRALAHYRLRLLAAGEKLRVEDLLPPAAPSARNGAYVFRQTSGSWNRASDLLAQNPPSAMRLVGPGKAMVAWAQPKVESDSTNSWAEIEGALAQCAEALDLVSQAARQGQLDFNLDYRQGPSLLLPHLAPLKQATQRLSVAALCALHHGDAAAASTNLQVMLALVRATENERLAISQLVRIAMAHIAFATTWELLQSPSLAEADLSGLQHQWAELRFCGPAAQALEMERALGQMTLERMRHSSAECRQILSLAGNGSAVAPTSFGQIGETVVHEIVVGTKEMQWRLALSYPDQLRALKGHQVLLDAIRSVCAGECFNQAASRQLAGLTELGLQPTNDESFKFFDPSNEDWRSLFSQSVTVLSRILDRVFAIEVARELAVTALARKRFQLSQGRYPTQLSELVPAFLPALPKDPANGQPLRYRVNPDGSWRLYSVGEDGIDDQGDGSSRTKTKGFAWVKGRDMVWPAAATPEEVRLFRKLISDRPAGK